MCVSVTALFFARKLEVEWSGDIPLDQSGKVRSNYQIGRFECYLLCFIVFYLLVLRSLPVNVPRLQSYL